jgi:elongation factor P
LISTNDIRTGMALDLPEGLFEIVEFQHVKPGKGHAFVRMKLKNLESGAVLDKTFRADEKVPLAVIDKKSMQYLYRDGETLVFMDADTYEQHTYSLELDEVARAAEYLSEGETVVAHLHGDKLVQIELPPSVVLEVSETEPGLKGDRVSGGTKPARLSTGLVVQVPLFIESGDRVRIDTRTGEYLTREQG